MRARQRGDDLVEAEIDLRARFTPEQRRRLADLLADGVAQRDPAERRPNNGGSEAGWKISTDRRDRGPRERPPPPPGFGNERMDIVVRLFDGLEQYAAELFSGATNAEVALTVSWFAGGWIAHHAFALGMSREAAQEMAEALISGVVAHEMTERVVGHA